MDMLLSMSHPHDRLCIKRRTGQIPLWPMDLPSCLRVYIDAGVGGGIAIRLCLVVGFLGGIVYTIFWKNRSKRDKRK
jgi:hypothetical protein